MDIGGLLAVNSYGPLAHSDEISGHASFDSNDFRDLDSRAEHTGLWAFLKERTRTLRSSLFALQPRY